MIIYLQYSILQLQNILDSFLSLFNLALTKETHHGGCAAEAIFAAPQRIAITLSPNYYKKKPAFHNEKESRRTWPRCHVSLEKSSKNYKLLKKMSQTKPHPSVPPPPAKSDGEYFPQFFHVVIPDPPNSPAVLTRRSGWQKSGERAG